MFNKILVLVSAVLALSSYASAIFFGWGSSEQSTPSTRYFYHKRLLQTPTYPSYSIIDPERRQPIPSVPIQVPLQAQLSPIPNIQNVQLVPCLCPVSPENPYESQAHYENVYVSPNGHPVSQQASQPNIVQQPQKK